MVYDLIIIGGGPAGVTAAIYAVRQNIRVGVITKNIGGQVLEKAVEIENYLGFSKISGEKLSGLFEQQLKENKIEVILEEVVKIEKKNTGFLIFTKEGKIYETYSAIIASGSNPRSLNIPGEAEFLGRGVSYCVICDGPLFKGKKVAVIGGGNAGLEAALFLSSYVQMVYILEIQKEMSATRENQEKIKGSQKIEVITSARVLKIQGENFVKSLVYQDLRTGEEKELVVGGVFIESGRVPATQFVAGLVSCNEKGEIIVKEENCQTGVEGLFAVGDCRNGKYKQIITAAADGVKAALSAFEYLRKNNQTFKNEQN